MKTEKGARIGGGGHEEKLSVFQTCNNIARPVFGPFLYVRHVLTSPETTGTGRGPMTL